jgi:hypothetical protein
MRASLSRERIRKRPRIRHSPGSNRLPVSRGAATGAVRGGEKRRAPDASRAQTPRSRASRFRAREISDGSVLFSSAPIRPPSRTDSR